MDTELNWESEQVKDWLITDEKQLAQVKGMDGDKLEVYVLAGKAPQGLYDSFHREPVSSWDDVDWNAIVERINDV